MIERFKRLGLDEGTALVVTRSESGDIGIAVTEDKVTTSVTFAARGTGGGRSPRTWHALVALLDAMHRDQHEFPD